MTRPQSTPAMVRRQQAAQAALNAYAGRRVDFRSRDCVRLVKFVGHQLGVRLPLLKGVRYQSEASAQRVLEQLGLPDLAAGVDRAGLVRIPPASAWIADIVALPADAPFGAALMINVGNGRLLGAEPGENRFAVLQPAEYLAAWRWAL